MNKYVKLCTAAFCAFAVVAIVIWTGIRSKATGGYTRNSVLMGTSASFTVYGADGDGIIDDIADRLSELETGVISWREEGAELYMLNESYEAGADYEVSFTLAHIISDTLAISDDSGNLLDITIRPLANLWGIEDGKTDIPDSGQIDEALTHVDCSRVSVTTGKSGSETTSDEDDGGALSEDDNSDEISDEKYYVNISQSDMALDLGAVGKGCGCDMAAEYLADTEVTGACISLGGSILVYGEKPDGSAWKVAVKNPRSGDAAAGETGSGDRDAAAAQSDSSDDILGVIEISAGGQTFVSTSGDYEKYFENDGVRYHHILDPTTGYPADKGTISATVVCGSGLESDALSTLCILMDREAVPALLEKYDAEAVLVDEDKNVYVTDGLAGQFTLNAEGYMVVSEWQGAAYTDSGQER